ARFRSHLARVPDTDSACHASGATAIWTRENRHRCRPRMHAELVRAALQQHAFGLDRKRWQRERLASRRLERIARETRDAGVPLDLRVVWLEVRITNRPIRDRGGIGNAEPCGLLELEFWEPPVVRREMHGAATDDAAIVVPTAELRLILVGLPTRTRLLLPIVRERLVGMEI